MKREVVRTTHKRETRFSLDGNTLTVEKVKITIKTVTTFDENSKKAPEVIRTPIGEEVTPLTFQLTEVTPEQIRNFRKQGVPSLIFKKDGKYYHCKIPKRLDLKVGSGLGTHLCGSSNHDCKRLSAASDENGGCAKVRGRATYIERYPFIKKGIETFCTNGRDAFVVLECTHFEEAIRREIQPGERSRLIVALANDVWDDDIKGIEDVRARIEKNKNN